MNDVQLFLFKLQEIRVTFSNLPVHGHFHPQQTSTGQERDREIYITLLRGADSKVTHKVNSQQRMRDEHMQ